MILVHTCCTTCAGNLLGTIETDLKLSKSDIALYYYNPNIHPESEWHARRQALQDTFGDLYQVIIANWSPNDFFKPLQNISEDNLANPTIRCPHCYLTRLKQTFQYAADNNFDTVTTTMLTSSYMNNQQIHAIGTAFGKQFGLDFYAPDKLQCTTCLNGYYKQNYCGCFFSLQDKLKEKYLKSKQI